MTPDQIRIVQETWAKLLPIKDVAAQLFYAKLFELEPSLRNLFPGDMAGQGQKLMQVMDVTVNGLHRLERIVPAVQALGRRHVGYGVTDQHYDLVAEALLWTLAKGLDTEFTQEVEEAWTDAYNLLATTMREAAATVPTAACN